MDGKQKTKFREEAFREVFEKAGLMDLGFKARKEMFTRNAGEFVDTISYGSSSQSNRLDETNVMIVRVSTEHKGFRQFQNETLGLAYLSGTIGGAHIENLYNAPPYISYDIGVSENQKETAVHTLVAAIKNQVLPFFESCRDANWIIENSHLPAFIPERLFEYFIFLDKKSAIQAILENLSNRTPAFKDHLQQFLEKMKKEGLENAKSEATWPDHVRTRAKNIAIRLRELNADDL